LPASRKAAAAAGRGEAAAGRRGEAAAGRRGEAAAGRRDEAAAVEHLRAADPVLRGLIDTVGELGDPRAGRPEDHYGTLVRSIIGQQVSTKAAQAIYGRLTDRYGGRTPTPVEVLEDDPEDMRAAAGLSRAKASYLRSLAQHVVEGSLELDRLEELPDDEVIAELVAVKGIGVWSAHMFLMFHLQRPDVLAVGDLGIRRAVMLAYGLDEMPDPGTVTRIGEPWRPYRTLACRYLWASLRAQPV
jgi:DNA-3-methyladenine glycosylase II